MSDNSDWRRYFEFGEVLHYFFRKKKECPKPNFNLRVMHGINRLAIIVFLAAVIFLIIKHIVY